MTVELTKKGLEKYPSFKGVVITIIATEEDRVRIKSSKDGRELWIEKSYLKKKTLKKDEVKEE